MSHHSVKLVLALICVCCGHRILAQQPPVTASCIAVEPWGFEESGTGVSCAFLSYLGQKADLAVKTDVRPLARVLVSLRDGSTDLTMVVPGAGRDEWALSLCEPTVMEVSITYLKNAGALSTVDDLAGKKIGILRGSFILSHGLPYLAFEPVYLPNMKQGFLMLASGRIDATFCIAPGCGVAMRAAHVDRDALGFLQLSERPIAVMVSRRSALAQDQDKLARLRDACTSPEGRNEILRLLAPYN